jgi:uncharacterized DUF497 family protein
MHIEIVFNNSAFKHGITEQDIRSALTTFLVDIALDDNIDEHEKFLIIGFDTKGNLLEIMYNIIDRQNINIFHAMKCRKEYLKLLER